LIPIYKALVEDEELEATAEALRRGWLGMGSYVADFEEAVEKAVQAGSRRAVALSTGHAALHLAMVVAGVGPGDEVIVPSFTHLADVQAILAVSVQAAELVTPATRAIVAMDYGPHLCDFAAVDALAEKFGLRVVHDAAHSFGSAVGEDPVGSFSDLCVFSFDPVKALSCIDGGVLMVRTEAELARLRELRVLGSTAPAERVYEQRRCWEYDARECGFRYHLSNVHAAIGLAQLAKLDLIRATRQAACERYRARLSGVEGLVLPTTDVSQLNPFLYYVRIPGGRRDEFRRHLADRGVESGIHWTPVHRLALSREWRRGPLDVAERIGGEIVSLPLHSGMRQETVDEVCDAVLSFFVSSPARLPTAGTRRRTVAARRAAPAPTP
jgi:dTDP-4-amino-4,6-dideoxygalactose transaminase